MYIHVKEGLEVYVSVVLYRYVSNMMFIYGKCIVCKICLALLAESRATSKTLSTGAHRIGEDYHGRMLSTKCSGYLQSVTCHTTSAATDKLYWATLQ